MPGQNRRKVLKRIGVGATGIVAATTTVSASGDSAHAPNNDIVETLLEAAGNPDVHATRTVVPDVQGEPSPREDTLIATEVETESGTLAFAEIDGPDGTVLLPGYFSFDSSGHGVPKQYRGAPGDTEVTLVYEDGNAHPRRRLTETEQGLVRDAVGVDEGAVIAYDEAYDSLFVISEERGRFEVDVERIGRTSYLRRPITPSIKSGRYSVVGGSDGRFTTLGDDCFDLFGPCPACVAGTVTCAACALACATGPQCAACLILTCGFTGGACGCCAICADGIPDPENAICPD